MGRFHFIIRARHTPSHRVLDCGKLRSLSGCFVSLQDYPTSGASLAPNQPLLECVVKIPKMIQRKVCHAERSRRIFWEFHRIATKSFGCAQHDKFLSSSKTGLRNVFETLNTHSENLVARL